MLIFQRVFFNILQNDSTLMLDQHFFPLSSPPSAVVRGTLVGRGVARHAHYGGA
jgi:hypothetical protein